MGLNKLGQYIKTCDLRNTEGELGEDSVVGISTQKMMIKTKANLDGVNLSSYKLLPPSCFAYVADTSRRGDKISLCFNNTEDTFLVSSITTIFSITDEEKLNADYLFMYFNRPEFDRYSRYNSWGSARETFGWSEICAIEIDLPPLDIQQKYVDVYNAMIANQQCYERGLDDLKLVCDAYIEELRRKDKSEPIGKYLCETRNKNEDALALKNKAVSNTKVFIDAKEAIVSGVETRNYLIVEKGDFAYNSVTTRNGDKLSIALNKGEKCLVSPIYTTFKVVDDNLLPEYLFLWLQRSEYDRYARFNSWGSAREIFSFKSLSESKISIPNIKTQTSIVNLLLIFERRKAINERLKEQIKSICPILIKGSLEEARKKEV